MLHIAAKPRQIYFKSVIHLTTPFQLGATAVLLEREPDFSLAMNVEKRLGPS